MTDLLSRDELVRYFRTEEYADEIADIISNFPPADHLPNLPQTIAEGFANSLFNQGKIEVNWAGMSDEEKLAYLTAAQPPAAPVETDWRDDPSADERWNAGLDYAMVRFCQCLGVDPKDVRWDAATEELDGDVCAVIGNILRAKFGEDFDPDLVCRSSADSARPKEAPEWIWYGEVDGNPVVSYGRWPKHGAVWRYKYAEIQPTEHDHGGRPEALGEAFERIIKALQYDGPDTNSLTVGEIRRALP